MSTTAKTIIWIIVAIVVIGGIWWWAVSSNSANQNNVGATQTGANTNSADQPADTGTTGSSIVSTGTSDADLDQDMTNLNVQMDGLASDSANVNQSVNDNSAAQ